VRSWLSTLVILLAACGHAGSAAPQPDATVRPPDSSIPVPDASPDMSVAPRYLCHQAPPQGAPQPVPPPMPASCPALVSGHNAMTSTGHARDFILVLPADPQPGETFPVLFMWHWIGGSADSFLEKGEVQAAADQQRFIAVIPSARGADVALTSFNTKWPFDITQPPDRMEEEFTFFDDMLACVEAQFPVDQNCVSTIGVSAGALFTDQLAQARSNRLASFLSLSGGVGDTIIKPWVGTGAHKLPGVVLWGGDGPPMMDGNKDILGCLGIGMDFSVASRDLEAGLTRDGHFFVECKHNCGHVEPPLVAPPGGSKYAGLWEFALDHPFWLNPGDSPYLANGLPSDLPSWCGIGPDSETPRSGSGCPAAENPCVE
jgi:predicted esterase